MARRPRSINKQETISADCFLFIYAVCILTQSLHLKARYSGMGILGFDVYITQDKTVVVINVKFLSKNCIYNGCVTVEEKA